MHVMMDSQVFNDILSLCGIQDLILMSGCIVLPSHMLPPSNCLLCNSRKRCAFVIFTIAYCLLA